MNDVFIELMTFNKISLSDEKLLFGEYDNCSFINCNFSSSDISDYSFAEFKFENCNPFLLTPEFISYQLNFAFLL